MEMYKKPVMEIVELEKVDVLTCSAEHNCQVHQSHMTCEQRPDECQPQQ